MHITDEMISKAQFYHRHEIDSFPDSVWLTDEEMRSLLESAGLPLPHHGFVLLSRKLKGTDKKEYVAVRPEHIVSIQPDVEFPEPEVMVSLVNGSTLWCVGTVAEVLEQIKKEKGAES